MPQKDLHLRNKARNLDEAEFIMRAQNGYRLFAFYTYEEECKKFFLNYTLSRSRIERKDVYVVTIEEGIEADIHHEYASKRSEHFEFSSVQEAVAYLKEKEKTRFLNGIIHDGVSFDMKQKK